MRSRNKPINIQLLAFLVQRELSRTKHRFVTENRYAVFEALKGARSAFRQHGYKSCVMCKRLYRYLSVLNKAPNEAEAAAFLKKHKATEDEILLFVPILTLAAAIYLCEGKDTVHIIRAALELDREKIVSLSSPLHSRLMLNDIYAVSSSATQRAVRNALKGEGGNFTAGRIRNAVNKSSSGAKYFTALLFSLTLLIFFCLIAAGCPILLCVLSLYSLFTLSYFLLSLFLNPIVKREPLPKLKDCPNEDCVVAVACLAGEDSFSVCQRLEDIYLSAHIENIHLVLLLDFPDGDSAMSEEDAQKVRELGEIIDLFNQKYGNKFFLLYRKKHPSPSEGRFIPRERKRGAVCELVRLLHTGEGDIESSNGLFPPKGTKHLIILDSDTLPTGIRDLLMTACHPLNRPVIENGRVTEGYGIIQPRMDTLLSSSFATPFARFTAGIGGTELYRHSSHGIYTALTKKASFCGKGYISVPTFYNLALDAFPRERILSHDIAEGELCRTGFCGEAVFYEGHPKGAKQYYKRKNRWVRGDFQSLVLCKRNGNKSSASFSLSARAMLVYRAISDLCALYSVLTLFFSLFYPGYTALFSLIALSVYLIPPLVSVKRILSPVTARRFFGKITAGTRQAFIRAYFSLSLVFYDALVSLFAALTALFRLCTGKRLLRWRTFAAEEHSGYGMANYLISFLPSFFFGLFVFLSSDSVITSVFALPMVFSPATAYLSSLPYKKNTIGKGPDRLVSYCRDAFSYFEDTVNESNSFLPPDNVQMLCGVGEAHRTSPTNIGLYLVSVVAASDLGIIKRDEVYPRLYSTLKTLTSLTKKDGLLYNWYDTRTKGVISEFVSTVDLGNYLACLTVVKESISEIEISDGRLAALHPILDKLIEECDLSLLYDENAGLFNVGMGSGAGSHYDLYCSEMLLTEYIATAFGHVPREHLSRLGAPPLDYRSRLGAYSWYGTAFEYFMPYLFLPNKKNSFAYEILNTAFEIQRDRGVTKFGKRLYGISESGYFAFDAAGNYQYKAHGVSPLALCGDNTEEAVISPYSLFLMLKVSDSPLKVLEDLKDMGMYGKYGFYEALDLEPARVGNGYAVISSFMAHHIGMTIIACCNRLYDDIFVRRFFKDPRIRSHGYLTEIKVPAEEKAYIPRATDKKPVSLRPVYENEKYKASVISNTVTRGVVTPSGISLHMLDVCIAQNSGRKLYRPTLLYKGGRVRDLFSYPLGLDGVFAEYLSEGARAEFTLCPDEKAWLIDVKGAEEGTVFTFAPIMFSHREYESHIAYCKLFVTALYEDKVLYITRRKKNGTRLVLAISAFGEDQLDIKCAASAYFFQSFNYASVFAGEFEMHNGAVGEPLVAVKCEYTDHTYILACGADEKEARDTLFRAAQKSVKEHKEGLYRLCKNKISPMGADPALISDTVLCLTEGKRPPTVLPRQSFDRDIFYRHGISMDLPYLVIDARGKDGAYQLHTVLIEYAEAIKQLLIKGERFDTVILYTESDAYGNVTGREVNRCLSSAGLLPLLGQKGGVFAVNAAPTEAAVLCDGAFAVYNAVTKKRTCPDLSERVLVQKASSFNRCSSSECTEQGVKIIHDGGMIPQSFIYAGRDFGTLVTDFSPGFTYYKNSRLYQISRHDTDTEMKGEAICLEYNKKVYDLCLCSREVEFKLSCAVYRGNTEGKNYCVKIYIDPDMPCKIIEFDVPGGIVKYKVKCALGDGERKPLYHSFLSGRLTVLTAERDFPFCMFLQSDMAVHGEFDGVYATLSVDMGNGGKARILLGAAEDGEMQRRAVMSKDGAEKRYLEMIKGHLSPFTLRTGDADFDMTFNVYAPYQALVARMNAKCGYSQVGGAVGFRDQLQDCLFLIYSAPGRVKEHIIDCCRHQYPEGDVMHWYHRETEMGVRTSCSDDRLWLVYTLYEYVHITGDRALLSLKVPFTVSPPLSRGEYERYEKVCEGGECDTVYGHMLRALLISLSFGGHGLCLMGTGDWNDGMDRAGKEGKGESVWLSMFLYECLVRGAYLANITGHEGDREMLLSESRFIKENVEKHGFDRDRYIRGFTDSAAPFGTSCCEECEIDILPQAFASICGFDKNRASLALDTATRLLYDRERRIFRLFSPPFESRTDIGVISAYPKGIRENGGQYTHGAIWGAIGCLECGKNGIGYEILRCASPLCRRRDASGFENFRREPYAICADISTNEGLYGLGGWSWYTGSAAWFYLGVLKHLLGYREAGGGFTLSPRFSEDFARFTLNVERFGTSYKIEASRDGIDEAVLDGKFTKIEFFPFDGKSHSLILKVRR